MHDDVLLTRAVPNIINLWPRPDKCEPIYDPARTDKQRLAGFQWTWDRPGLTIRAWGGYRTVYINGIVRMWLPLEQLNINGLSPWHGDDDYVIDFAWYPGTLPSRINGLDEIVEVALKMHQESMLATA